MKTPLVEQHGKLFSDPDLDDNRENLECEKGSDGRDYENGNSAPRNAPIEKSVLGTRNAMSRQAHNHELEKQATQATVLNSRYILK